jgi:hypothetical protein
MTAELLATRSSQSIRRRAGDTADRSLLQERAATFYLQEKAASFRKLFEIGSPILLDDLYLGNPLFKPLRDSRRVDEPLCGIERESDHVAIFGS